MRLWWQQQTVRMIAGAESAKAHGWLLAMLALFFAMLYTIATGAAGSIEILA